MIKLTYHVGTSFNVNCDLAGLQSIIERGFFVCWFDESPPARYIPRTPAELASQWDDLVMLETDINSTYTARHLAWRSPYLLNTPGGEYFTSASHLAGVINPVWYYPNKTRRVEWILSIGLAYRSEAALPQAALTLLAILQEDK
jgi:hypothetical protein